MTFRHYHRRPRIRFNATSKSYTPTQLAKLYGFPADATGAGKKIAVIELGGAYSQADLDSYFASLGLKVKPVVFHGIQGAGNVSDGPDGADGEVMLDLCVIGGMAPGCEMHCYTAPNTDAGFLAAIKQARLDGMDCISISWGGPEDAWDSTTMRNYNVEFQACAAAGITVTAASGDNGSGDGERGNHVDFPASSPYVLGCGGTSLPSTSPLTEVVWNDGTRGGATGGGVSAAFALPAYQANAGVPGGKMRGVPDVAANADPETGWLIVVDGQRQVIGGTSAVAPMMAALFACLAEKLGKNLGQPHVALYGAPGTWNRDVTQGNNGTYIARQGYDNCTGLGCPVGTKLLAVFSPAPVPTPVPAPPAPTPAPVSKTEVITITGTDFAVKVA